MVAHWSKDQRLNENFPLFHYAITPLLRYARLKKTFGAHGHTAFTIQSIPDLGSTFHPEYFHFMDVFDPL